MEIPITTPTSTNLYNDKDTGLSFRKVAYSGTTNHENMA
jgi:hypothetical protein